MHIYLPLLLVLFASTIVLGCSRNSGGSGDSGSSGRRSGSRSRTRSKRTSSSWHRQGQVTSCKSGGPVHSNNQATKSDQIATVAESYVGSENWCYACSSGFGADTNKCNYFVYDVGLIAGAQMPERKFARTPGPVGAGGGGWGKAWWLDYWERVKTPKRGDIVAAHSGGVYHVGIYVACDTTVSANSDDIGKNSWPWGSDYSHYTDIVIWRYKGN